MKKQFTTQRTALSATFVASLCRKSPISPLRAVDKVSIGARVCDPQHCDLQKTGRIAPKAALRGTACCGSQTRAPTLSTACLSCAPIHVLTCDEAWKWG